MNPFELLKNTQAIKEQSEKLQAELASLTAEGSSGGRMVTVTLNGKFEMQNIKLDPICVDNRDVKMLEDLIVAAHNNAMENIQEQIKAKSSSLNPSTFVLEREYLSTVIKPFRKKISCIRKSKDSRKGKNYIKIEFCDGDCMFFPNLSNNAMYKGMKIDRNYTLEELGL